jgi:hypothetical protein
MSLASHILQTSDTLHGYAMSDKCNIFAEDDLFRFLGEYWCTDTLIMASAPPTPMSDVRNNPRNVPEKVYWHVPLAHYTIE